MNVVALTGTPGTGKTSVAGELSGAGYSIVHVDELIRSLGVRTSADSGGGSTAVDVPDLKRKAAAHWNRAGKGPFIVVGHLSHYAGVEGAVVLRCSPAVLEKRLQARGWSSAKIRENVQAEVLDVILVEAAESLGWIREIDTTSSPPSETAAAVLKTIEGKMNNHPVPSRWSGEIEKWF
jgi:adenylate kinase